MMKKVCILTSVHPPFDTRIFHREAMTLSNAGYKISLIAQADKSEDAYGINVVGIGKSKNRAGRFLKIWKIFKRAIAEKADIYHIHEPELLLIGLAIKFFTNKAVIYDIHEDFPGAARMRHWIPKVIREPIAQFVNIYEPFLSRFLDAVITADDNIKKRFQFKNTVTIFNFPKIDYFLEESKERIKDLIIHPGTLNEERGADIIVKAIEKVKQKFPEVKVLLIGSTHNPEYEKHLKESIKKLNLEDNISLKPAISQKEVISYISKASLGLSLLQPIPKFNKNIPQKIFEYMASGVPFVVSDLPPTRPFIEEYNCGILVNSTDISQISEAIIYLLTNSEEAQKMGQNGRKAVLEKYNWEREAKKLLNLYEKVSK